MPTSEAALVQAVISYLRARGAVAWRNNSGTLLLERHGVRRAVHMGLKGLPDVCAVWPPYGRLIAVECKRPGNRLSEWQRQMLIQLGRAGALIVVAYSVPDVEAALAAATVPVTHAPE